MSGQSTGEALAIVDYDASWPLRFAELGKRLRGALGTAAVRIDHIGSTAVPGLAAKPIIDIQVSVASLEPVDAFRRPLEQGGFMWRPDNPERTKRYFRERPGEPRTHLHVRKAGTFSEQFALLFRDYLRVHREAADEYAAVKRELAGLIALEPQQYSEAKGAFVWRTIRQADEWAPLIGWEPPPSDA